MSESGSSADRVLELVNQLCLKAVCRERNHGYTCFVGEPDQVVGNSFLLIDEQRRATHIYVDAGVRSGIDESFSIDEMCPVDHVRTYWKRLSEAHEYIPHKKRSLRTCNVPT